MITTLTPNPCIDKTLALPAFDLYKMNRVRVVRSDFGGKGINVSTALHALGVSSRSLALSFAGQDAAFRENMQLRGIPFEFITVPGAMRCCLKIFDESRKHTIEINESGVEVAPDTQEKLLELLKKHAAESSIVTLSGSLPKSFGKDFYFRCAEAVKKVSPACRILVDAEKELLLNALPAGVDFLKPNIHEFEETFQLSADTVPKLDAAARRIARDRGLILCVSRGADGAYITDGQKAYVCSALPVEVRSIQGAGDSLIAGMCMAYEDGKPLPEILHYGVAAASDSIAKEGTLLCRREGVLKLLDQPFDIREI